MAREISDANILSKFVNEFCRAVAKHSGYIIVSGFVAIASGRARGTEDIDMILPRMKKGTFSALHNDLIKRGFVCMQSENADEIYKYLADNLSIRYTWKDRPIPEMEVKFAKDKIDQLQFKTKTKLPLTGLNIWFSSISMNIAFKEGYLKSPKDWEDARHLRAVYPNLVNEKKIIRIKKMLKGRK